MALEKKGNESKSSATPILIIGIIAVATIAGIYFVSQSGNNDPGTTNSNSSTAQDTARNNYANAPAGATPPNVLGSPESAIVVEEFADFQCPTCATVHPKVKEVVSQYGSKIKFVFRHFPISQIHKNAYDAAVASEAAGLQGKFWQMQDLIFKNQPTWSNMPNARPTFKEYAEKIGLDADRFENDSLGLSAKSRVDADIMRARALRISSTPTILINGKAVPFQQMDIEPMKKLIDAEIALVNNAGKEEDSAGSESDQKDGDAEEK